MFCLQCPFIQVGHRPKYEGQWRTYGDNGVTSWDFGQTLCKLTAMWFQLICSYLNYFCTFPYIYLLLRLFRRFSLGLSRHSPCHVSHNNWTHNLVTRACSSWSHKKVQEGITIIAFKLQAYKFRQRIRRERMSSTASWLVSFIISHIHHSISIFFFEYNKLIINLYSPNESEILFASVAHQSSRQGHFYFNNWKVTIT